jgi:D-glycero-alpha-D-manno-heptose-7-phosphate kinase
MFQNLLKLTYSKVEILDSNNIEDIEHPLIREAMKLVGIKDNLEITSMAEIPSKSGLGSSGSFLVGLLNALHTYKKENVSRKDLAEEAFHIEAEILKEPVGKQDQYIASFGGITCFNISKNGRVSVEPLKLSTGSINELQNNLLIFYTGFQRKAGDILRNQHNLTKKNNKKVLESLHKIREMGLRIRDCLKTGDITTFGCILNEHWNTKKQLSNNISNEFVDKWYDIGLKNGALGGKLIGAGAGGFLMLYIDKNKEKLRNELRKEGLMELNFRFDFEGTKIIVNI